MTRQMSRERDTSKLEDIESLLLPTPASIRTAMAVIDNGGVQFGLSCSPSGILKGVITDGDIRRALLGGASMDDPIDEFLNKNFVKVSPGEGRHEVLDLMRALRIKHVPIVDVCGSLRGVHLLESLISNRTRANCAVILAGGKGTRLRPITERFPKPMLKVAGRPILERLVLHLAGHGIRKIYLSINYMAEVIEEHFGNGKRFGCDIEYLREEEPLGTAGPLGLLPGSLQEPLLVANGDLVTQFDVSAMLKQHETAENLATVGVKLYNHQVPFGCVSVSQGRVQKLEEKPTMTSLINAGIYILEPAVAKSIKPNKCVQMTDLLRSLLEQGERVGAYELTEDWIDIGQRESLTLAREGL